MQTLSIFAPPDGELADLPEECGQWPQSYEHRDAKFNPDKPLQEWREEIEAMLQKGAPYGKTTCTREETEGYMAWAAALANLPALARPRDVYALAPEIVLVHMGW